jgi:paraquat-inducible protein B
MAESNRAAIGAFVLGGVVLGIGAVVLFGNWHLFQPVHRAEVVFDGSISGLAVGAPVSFRGVRVGEVQRIVIQIDPRTRQFFVPVTVLLEQDRIRVGHGPAPKADLDVKDLIQRGLRAQINTVSFVTGQSEIALEFDPNSTPVLHPDLVDLPEIPTRPSTFEKVERQLSQLPIGELVQDAMTTLKSLHSLTTTLNDGLPKLLTSVTQTSDHAGQTVQSASTAITDLQGRLDVTLAQLDKLTSGASTALDARSADLHAVLTSARQSLQEVDGVLASVQTITSPRGEERVNLDSILRDLAAATAALRAFSNDVEHNPQLLLTGRHP